MVSEDMKKDNGDVPDFGNVVHVEGFTDRDIQSAVNDVENGGVVILKEGEYRIERSIFLRNNITVKGQGREKTFLRLSDGANCHIITNRFASGKKTRVRNSTSRSSSFFSSPLRRTKTRAVTRGRLLPIWL